MIFNQREPIQRVFRTFVNRKNINILTKESIWKDFINYTFLIKHDILQVLSMICKVVQFCNSNSDYCIINLIICPVNSTMLLCFCLCVLLFMIDWTDIIFLSPTGWSVIIEYFIVLHNSLAEVNNLKLSENT